MRDEVVEEDNELKKRKYIRHSISVRFGAYRRHNEDGVEVIENDVREGLVFQVLLLFVGMVPPPLYSINLLLLGLAIFVQDWLKGLFDVSETTGETPELGVEQGQYWVEELGIVHHINEAVHGIIEVSLYLRQLHECQLLIVVLVLLFRSPMFCWLPIQGHGTQDYILPLQFP